MLPDFWVLGAHSAELTPTVHATRGIVHWPILCAGVVFGHLEDGFEIAKPLVDELIAGVDGSAGKAVGGLKQNLRSFDDNPAHWTVEDDLPGEGI